MGANTTGASFVTVSRAWSAGDVLSLHLPCSVRLVRLDDTRPRYANSYSFVYGDTLLVGLETGGPNPNASNALRVPSLNASEWTVPVRAEEVDQGGQQHVPQPLRFRAQTLGRTVDLMPLNEVVEERYTVYFNLTDAGSGRRALRL